nr:DIE2/ALG10 family [Tanacetum cinerariifolium]
MGSHHLHANVTRFMRPPAVKSCGYTHQNEACEPALLLDESCLNQLHYSLGLLGKIKEFSSIDNIRMGKMLYLVKLDEGCLYSKRLCILTTGKSNILETFKIIHKGKRFSVRAKETTRWILDFNEQEEDNSESEDEQSIGFIKEDFDGSDVEKEGDNNVSMVPDSVKEDVNVQAEEKEVECDKKSMGNNEGSGFSNEKGESVSIGSKKSNKIDIQRTGGSLLTVMEELIK